ncbi:CPBP family intramembrane glutamic endopeptidase [Demequina globuliformis]|uniref:CPBP family intramembrane glutamic endopeptidase n=1 Tax=Demequina globuliformis TaxID=676202 RepID=UPI00078033DB|nr:CPBP family intramembrane glutamic endopeptidase [Demequina globuliformis]
MSRSVVVPSSAPHASRRVEPARTRNLVAFAVGVLGLSVVGAFGAAAGGGDPEQSPAALLFILSPLLMAVILRSWAGDGWADAGLRPRFRGNGRWYLLAVALFPALTAAVLAVGWLLGGVSFAPGAAGTLAAGVAGALVLRLVYAACEEFGWRGYVEPRLASRGVPAAARHLMVAAVWGLWHIPYVVVFGSQSGVPLSAYLTLFVLAMVPMSFIYGAMQERSGTVWPAVIMHGVANAVAFPVLLSGAVTVTNEWWFAARPEGLVMLAGLVFVAALLWRRRRVAPGV